MAFVLELQDDYTVKRWEVSLVFPRKDTKPLYIVSNTRSNLFLLQSPPAQHAMLKDRKAYDAKSDKICFQYGVSSKVFSVECAECKVHLLLSPSEISRLFQVFNVIGFVCSYLVSEEGQEHLRSLLAGPASAAAQELCKAASRFFCPSESITGHDFSKKLKEILMDKLREACKGLSGHTELGVMVLCALVALAAADLATMIGSSEQEDSDIEKLGKSFVNTQFNEMVKLFDVEAELLTVLYQGKNIFVVFRNPKTEDWASGATKQTSHGQTISFGLCHKVFSITTAGCEIQFIQNLQETYTMVETFYLPGFAKHLLMSDKWRKKLGRLQKEGDGNGGLMEELSQLAVRFLCVEGCQKTSFTRKLEKQMKEKCTNNHIFPRGGEGLLVLGTLMAIMTAVTATLLNKNDMDDCSGDNGMNETSPAVTAMSMNENDMGKDSCDSESKEAGDAEVSGEAGEAGDAEASREAGEAGDAEASREAGEAGDAGASGKAGVAGDAEASGEAGEAGDAEASGEAGEAGDAEASGEAGVAGDAEASGEAGVAGDAEASREAGEAGETGDVKASGEAVSVEKEVGGAALGALGAAGLGVAAAGASGVAGLLADGLVGTVLGAAGVAGQAGAAVVAGQAGAEGVAEAAGVAGQAGATVEAGAAGEAGSPSESLCEGGSSHSGQQGTPEGVTDTPPSGSPRNPNSPGPAGEAGLGQNIAYKLAGASVGASAISLVLLRRYFWDIINAVMKWVISKIPHWILFMLIFLMMFSIYFFMDLFIWSVNTMLMPIWPTLLITVAVPLCVMLAVKTGRSSVSLHPPSVSSP